MKNQKKISGKNSIRFYVIKKPFDKCKVSVFFSLIELFTQIQHSETEQAEIKTK